MKRGPCNKNCAQHVSVQYRVCGPHNGKKHTTNVVKAPSALEK